MSGHRHGDYEEGELDQLLLDAKRSPDLYVEESEYDHIDIAYIQGKQIVPDCVCGHAERVATFIEDHFKEIARYISECMKDRERDRKQEAKDDVDAFKAVELALRGTQ